MSGLFENAKSDAAVQKFVDPRMFFQNVD